MRSMIATMGMILLAGLAVAQPAGSEPGRVEVPQVPEVANPVPPAVPGIAGGSVAGNHCACPTTQCANGDVRSCEISCSAERAPICSCDGFCDSDGSPKGVNRCACQ